MQALKLDGYHLMYPGDSSAPGYWAYNCHCTTVAVVDGVDTGDTMRRGRDPETGQNELVEDMIYIAWANSHPYVTIKGLSFMQECEPFRKAAKELRDVAGKTAAAIITNQINGML